MIFSVEGLFEATYIQNAGEGLPYADFSASLSIRQVEK